jgi:hypothetical protein
MTDTKPSALDWWMTLCAGVMLVGLYLDGWAHRHIPNLETFFTPWHGVLYAGFFATFGLLGAVAWKHHARGWPWAESVPAGYGLSLIGMLLFFAAGIGDLIWHTLFGIEARLDALLSPTHLILAVGGTLIGAGPFRAAWRRPTSDTVRLRDLLPMLLSLTFGWSILTFFTQFAHSFVRPLAAGAEPQATFYPQALELAGILLQSAIMMGVILLIMLRWRLPFGSLTVALTLNAAFVTMLETRFGFIAVGLLAGVIGDLLLQRWRPSADRPVAFRLFAGALPAIYYAAYFLGLMLTSGVWWAVHLWTGAIVMAGLAGWLISYLLLPPNHPPLDT